MFSVRNDNLTTVTARLAANIISPINAAGADILTAVKNSPNTNGLCYLTISSTTTNLPASTAEWQYAMGMVLSKNQDKIIVLYSYNSGKIATAYYNASGATWSTWTVK